MTSIVLDQPHRSAVDRTGRGIEILLSSAETAGTLAILECQIPPGTSGPPLHAHPGSEDVKGHAAHVCHPHRPPVPGSSSYTRQVASSNPTSPLPAPNGTAGRRSLRTNWPPWPPVSTGDRSGRRCRPPARLLGRRRDPRPGRAPRQGAGDRSDSQPQLVRIGVTAHASARVS